MLRANLSQLGDGCQEPGEEAVVTGMVLGDLKV